MAGIQDAHNLAEKLALTAKGQAQPALLNSYHPERNAVGELVLKKVPSNFRPPPKWGKLSPHSKP